MQPMFIGYYCVPGPVIKTVIITVVNTIKEMYMVP